jgi:hypothetical protein
MIRLTTQAGRRRANVPAPARRFSSMRDTLYRRAV